LGDAPATAAALLELAQCRHLDPAAAAAHLEAAIVLSREHGLARTELRALWLRAAVHVEAGEFEAADAAADVAERALAALGGDEMARLGLQIVRSMRARRVGALEQAIEGFAAAAAEAEAASAWERAWEARVGLARVRLASGDPAGAWEALAPALERWEGGPEGATPAWVALAQTGVEAANGLGDVDEAARLARLAARLAPGPISDYADALVVLGRGGRPPVGRLEGAAAALERTGRRPEAARMRMVGAEALARLAGGEDEAAELAAGALRAHREMGGEDWARRAEGLLRRLGRRAPTRRSGALREGLTPREVEVLGLVAEGLSNRAVAERLVISEATAARHVFNLFGKLGVHTRAQAARIYAERGLGREPEAAGPAGEIDRRP
jgi:ATP/maltotriose-dependent transcriptional regulator MalT